jgi:hypothetical protein
MADIRQQRATHPFPFLRPRRPSTRLLSLPSILFHSPRPSLDGSLVDRSAARLPADKQLRTTMKQYLDVHRCCRRKPTDSCLEIDRRRIRTYVRTILIDIIDTLPPLLPYSTVPLEAYPASKRSNAMYTSTSPRVVSDACADPTLRANGLASSGRTTDRCYRCIRGGPVTAVYIAIAAPSPLPAGPSVIITGRRWTRAPTTPSAEHGYCRITVYTKAPSPSAHCWVSGPGRSSLGI